jgi:hypothetical protein
MAPTQKTTVWQHTSQPGAGVGPVRAFYKLQLLPLALLLLLLPLLTHQKSPA